MHNVLVTGGSRGIGLSISRRIAAAGYNVIAVARRESDELRDAIAEAVKQGRGGLHFKACDLREIDALPAFVKNVRDEFGGLKGKNSTSEVYIRNMFDAWRGYMLGETAQASDLKASA